jgi:hypothetical protein
MGNAKSETKFFQYPKGLVAEPRFISELKDMTMEFRTRECREKNAEFLQSLNLEFKPRGKLPEHHA